MDDKPKVTVEKMNMEVDFTDTLHALVRYRDEKLHASKGTDTDLSMDEVVTVCEGRLHLLGTANTLLSQFERLLDAERINEQTLDISHEKWWNEQLKDVSFEDVMGSEVTQLELAGYEIWWVFNFQVSVDNQVKVLSMGINGTTGEACPSIYDQLSKYPLISGHPKEADMLKATMSLKDVYYLACQAVEMTMAEQNFPLVASIVHSVECKSDAVTKQAEREFQPFYGVDLAGVNVIYLPVLSCGSSHYLQWPGPTIKQK